MSEQAGNVLDQLKAGIRRFQTEVYPQHSAEDEHAATRPQKPHTLSIACADSRIGIETITDSRSGDVFIARNVGNHLETHPSVRGAMARGEFSVSGWIYDIASGDVPIYKPDTKKFEPTLQSQAMLQQLAQGAATA